MARYIPKTKYEWLAETKVPYDASKPFAVRLESFSGKNDHFRLGEDGTSVIVTCKEQNITVRVAGTRSGETNYSRNDVDLLFKISVNDKPMLDWLVWTAPLNFDARNGDIIRIQAMKPKPVFPVFVPLNKVGFDVYVFEKLDQIVSKPSRITQLDQQQDVDCLYNGWRVKTACPKECGNGVLVKVPNVIRYPKGNGKSCPSPTYEKCPELKPCPPPVDCSYNGWIIEQDCPPCGNGYRISRPKIVTRDRYGGKPCPTSKKEPCASRSCPTAVDCEYQGWITKVPCPRCGPANGQSMMRVPYIVKEARGGGVPCPLPEYTPCNDAPPCPKSRQ